MSKKGYIKVKDRVRMNVVLPPIPAVIKSESTPITYPKDCIRCGKVYETSIKVEVINQCNSCWNPKKRQYMVQSTYTFKGLKCKKNLPK